MNEVGALITAIALFATLVARQGVAVAARPRDGGVAAQLRRVYTLIALLLALRLAFFAYPATLVLSATMVVAAWLPLAALRLGEELVRRHAPAPIKWLALGGAIGFSLLAITFGLVWTLQAVVALAVFQAVTVGAVLLHLLRYRGGVSQPEQRTADMIALAWLFAVPLVLTDFRYLFPDLPVRGGVFAALLFVLASSRLLGERGRSLWLLADVAVCLGAGVIAAFGAGLADGRITMGLSYLDYLGEGLIVMGAIFSALAALMLLIERFGRADQGEAILVDDLAKAAQSKTALLSAHPLLASGIPLGASDLADLPEGTLDALAKRRVISRQEESLDDATRGAAMELLDRYEASHLVRIETSPPRFLAVSGGALSARRLSSELEISSRLVESAA